MILCDRSVFRRDKFCESLVTSMIGMRMIACIMVLRFVVLSLSMPSVKGTRKESAAVDEFLSSPI